MNLVRPTVAVLLTALVATVYWPVTHAGFVWVDKICFHDNAWLRYGDAWRELIFRNFYVWVNYFRPLVVAMFTLEVRLFDADAGPMHVISLAFHLANSVMVGRLALAFLGTTSNGSRRTWVFALAMIGYGLHPALIEPVVWISCQFDLVATFFILAALLFNVHARSTALRAVLVGACFFLAACAKESAAALPLLLVLCDWFRETPATAASAFETVQRLWARQAAVYATAFAAGVVYLVLRYWALGKLVQPIGARAALTLEHLQTVTFLYVTYWRILVWPMTGLSPVHEIGTQQFAAIDWQWLSYDLLAFVLVAFGAWLCWKRAALGALIASCSIALLPTLHLLPVSFDSSLYHERYAMTAAAMMFAWLPRVVVDGGGWFASKGSWQIIGALLGGAWLVLAVVNIRVTLPLWSDEARLWQWVLREDPHSVMAKDHLLSTWIERNDHPRARALAEEFVSSDGACANCLVNATFLFASERDLAQAATALHKAKDALARSNAPQLLQPYVLATGQVRELSGDLAGAEDAYVDAIGIAPLEPQARVNLALLLARQHRTDEARAAFAQAEALVAPDERDAVRRDFAAALGHEP